MEFRSDINALRAIAVLAVCLFHFSVPGFSGGFSGVDVFFVISGYLMSRIIISKMDSGSFSLLAFYQARGQRIIPALAVLCFATLILGWFLLEHVEYETLGKHAAGAIGFYSNILFQNEAGYFDQVSQKKWLLHTWSLSVEWQFYLLSPLFLLFLYRVLDRIGGKKYLRWIVLGIALISFASCIINTKTMPSAAFYGLTQRAWEMLAGGLVYLFPLSANAGMRKLISSVGLTLIGGAIFFLGEQLSWPGWWATIPVAGCALVIWSQADFRFLNYSAIQSLGRISYSVYLWHRPLVVLLNYFGKQQILIWVAGALSLSLILGTLSFTWIEKKCSEQFSRLGKPWLMLVIICILIMAAGVQIVRLNGIPGEVRAINKDKQILFLKHYRQLHLHGLHNFYRLECDYYDAEKKPARTEIDENCTPKNAAGGVFLWGDSHAQALSHGLSQALPKGMGFAQVATSGCRPSLGSQLHKTGINNNCDRSNQFALDAITALKPRRVFLAQEAEHEQTDWNALAKHLRSLGVPEVILVGPVPQWRPSLPQIIVGQHWGDTQDHVQFGLDLRIEKTDVVLTSELKNSLQIRYVSLFKTLCNKFGCLARLPGNQTLMALDYGHLTPEGSIFVVGHAILPHLNQINNLTH